METRVWECWWFEQHWGSGTGASRPIQAPMGLQTALGWHREPFPPLHPAGLCLPYPKAPPFVLGSQGPLGLAPLTFSS